MTIICNTCRYFYEFSTGKPEYTVVCNYWDNCFSVVLQSRVDAKFDFTFMFLPGFVWKHYVYRNVTLKEPTNFELECKGFCYFDQENCDFALIHEFNDCYLGRFADLGPIATTEPQQNSDTWTNLGKKIDKRKVYSFRSTMLIGYQIQCYLIAIRILCEGP